MRIGLVAPISSLSTRAPWRHGTHRCHACRRSVAAGHNVTVFASGDSQTPAPSSLPFLARCATRIIPLTPPRRRSYLAEVYDRASEFDVIHNHAGPLAFPFARSAPYRP